MLVLALEHIAGIDLIRIANIGNHKASLHSDAPRSNQCTYSNPQGITFRLVVVAVVLAAVEGVALLSDSLNCIELSMLLPSASASTHIYMCAFVSVGWCVAMQQCAISTTTRVQLR